MDDESACGLPVALQIERLERALALQAISGVSVLNTDLYSLDGTERDAALDAVVAGSPSPYVFVSGRLVCTGGVDASAVIEALSSTARDASAATPGS